MDKKDIGIGLVGLVGIAYVVSNGVMLADFIKGRKYKPSEGESFEADETVCLMCGDYKDPKKAYCCGDCSGYANQRVNPLGGKSGGGFPRGDIAKAVLTLKEYGGEMSANQWKARIRDIRPTRKELNTNEIHKLVNYLNPDIYIKTPGKIITYQITGGNCYDDWAKERYQAESFDAELKKDSCCCGATIENPCLCMEEGVMNCSAVEPKCPCYAAKDAESFEAERNPNQCMHCNEVLYEIEVWEDFRCPHCNNSIGDIYSDEISYDDYMSAESFEADACPRCGDTETYDVINTYCTECGKLRDEVNMAESFEAEKKNGMELILADGGWEGSNVLSGDEDAIKYVIKQSAFIEGYRPDLGMPEEWDMGGKEWLDQWFEDNDLETIAQETGWTITRVSSNAVFWGNRKGITVADETWWGAESFDAEAQDNIEKMIHFLKTGDAKGLSIPWEYDNQGQVVIYTGCTMKENGEVIEMTYCEQCGSPEWSDGGCTNEGNCELAMNAESFEAPGEMEEEDFTPMDITQCHVCARPYEYSRIARALVQHYLKESKDGTMGWKTKGNPDGTRRTVRNIAGYQLYWFGLGALENYLEEGKISKMTPMVIELLRTAIVPNIIAGDVVQFIESMEIDDIEDTDPKFFTDFSDTWEAPDDRLRPERPSDDSWDRRKPRRKPKKPWNAETEPSE